MNDNNIFNSEGSKSDMFEANEFNDTYNRTDKYPQENNNCADKGCLPQYPAEQVNTIEGEWTILDKIETLISERNSLFVKSTALNNEFKEGIELRKETPVIQTIKERQAQIIEKIGDKTGEIKDQVRQLMKYYNTTVEECKVDVNEINTIISFSKSSPILKRLLRDNKRQIKYLAEKIKLSQTFMEKLEVIDEEGILDNFRKYLKSIQIKEIRKRHIIKNSLITVGSIVGISLVVALVFLGLDKLGQTPSDPKVRITNDVPSSAANPIYSIYNYFGLFNNLHVVIKWVGVLCNLLGFILVATSSISYLLSKGDFNLLIRAKKRISSALFIFGFGLILQLILVIL